MTEDVKAVVSRLLKWLDPMDGDTPPGITEIHATLAVVEDLVADRDSDIVNLTLKLGDPGKFHLELDDIEMKLVFEAVATMRMTSVQRLEMAMMAKRSDGEKAFLRDKVERLSAIEDRFLDLLNPNATRLRDGKETAES